MREICSYRALIISNHNRKFTCYPFSCENIFVVTFIPVDSYNMDKHLGHSIPLPYRYGSFIMQEIQVLLAVSPWLSGVVIDQTFKGVAFLFIVAEMSLSIVKAMVW